MRALFDIESYLTSKGCQVKPQPPDEIHTHCFFHGEDTSKRGRLYINVVDQDPPGLFMCHRCGETGALNKLRKHFGDPPLDKEEGFEPDAKRQARYEIFQASAAYYQELLTKNEEVMRWLQSERGLTEETILKHQIGWADGTLKLHLETKGFDRADIVDTGLMTKNGSDFLYGHVSIPYHNLGAVIQIRGKEIGGKYLTPSGQKASLFNLDAARGADEVLITEGEFDALVLEQQGYSAVGVPGAVSWQKHWTQHFDRVKRAYIVFDNDETGRRGSERLAVELGAKARIIHMPEPEPGEPKIDPTEFFVSGHSKDDFEVLLRKSRGGNLLTVYDACEEWLEMQGVQGIPLGYDAIDAHIQPGLLPGQLLIWLAKTGAGKTILLLNFIHQMTQANPDFKALFVSLEQTRSEWMERARRIYRFHNPQAADLDVLDYYADHLMITDKNRMTMEEMEDAVDEYELVQGRKPDVVFVDYLGYFARSYPGEGYERTSAAVMELKGFAKDHRLVVAAPHQVSRMVKFGEEMEADVGRESGVVEETADFLFGLWSKDMRKGLTGNEDKTGEVWLKILKSRHGGVGNSATMKFCKQSLVMLPEFAPKEELAKFDREMSCPGGTIDGVPAFEQMLYEHATGNKFNKLGYDQWNKTLGLDEDGAL